MNKIYTPPTTWSHLNPLILVNCWLMNWRRVDFRNEGLPK